MDFLTALGTVINGNISETRISEMTRDELNLLEDAIEELGNARTAKEEFDDYSKDALDVTISESERAECTKWANEARDAYYSAQGKLKSISEKASKNRAMELVS